MIRVLHVVSSLNINAGMMNVVMNYYRHINRDKIQFDFLYFFDIKGNFAEEIQSLGGRCFYFPKPSFLPKYQKKLKNFFNRHKGEYSAVHCHPIWASEIVSRQAKKSGIKHIIQHSHSVKYSEGALSNIRNRFLVRFIGLFATDYVACSSFASEVFGKNVLRKHKVFILKNAIDTQKYKFDLVSRDSVRNEFGILPEDIVIGNVGRLTAVKNQVFAVKVFSKIKERYEHSVLLLVGEGEARKEIEEAVAGYGLEKSVILTGKRSDVKELLSAMDVFLMPSVFEGSPMAAIEALTSGLFCLMSSSVPKVMETDKAKYLSLQESEDVWAEECLKMAKAGSPEERHCFKNIVDEGFDIATEVVKLEKYYEDLQI